MPAAITYLTIYHNMMQQRQQRGWTRKNAPCYVEQHHITPKCLGGTNESDNLVFLTAREHFIAHHLLHRAYPDNYHIAFAFTCMSMRDHVPITPREFAYLRQLHTDSLKRRKLLLAHVVSSPKTCSRQLGINPPRLFLIASSLMYSSRAPN